MEYYTLTFRKNCYIVISKEENDFDLFIEREKFEGFFNYKEHEFILTVLNLYPCNIGDKEKYTKYVLANIFATRQAKNEQVEISKKIIDLILKGEKEIG